MDFLFSKNEYEISNNPLNGFILRLIQLTSKSFLQLM